MKVFKVFFVFLVAMQEDVLGITMTKYRKTQSLLEEAERRADKAEKSSTLGRHTSTTINIGSARPGMKSHVSQQRNDQDCQSIIRSIG